MVLSRRMKAVFPWAEPPTPIPTSGAAGEADATELPASHGGRRRAAGIYGTIVVAATMATGGSFLHTWALAISVVVTLLVYWLAEQYAEILGEHAHAGRLPKASAVRASLADTWPMVTASYLPVLVLVLAHWLGEDTGDAALIALFSAVVILVVHGHAAGRAAGLKGARLVTVTVMAAALGGAMVALKVLVQYLH